MKNKNIIYTVLTNNYDNLKTPKVISSGWDYVCFTDDLNLKSDVWEFAQIPQEYTGIVDSKRQASLLKIEYYNVIDKEYDTVIYLDASLTININLNDLVDNVDFDDKDMVVCIHGLRKCIYQEADVVMKLGLDSKEIISAQMRRYLDDGFTRFNGLWSGGFRIIKNKSLNLRRAHEIWSEEYKKGSKRDQLSYVYSFWKCDEMGYPNKIEAIEGLWDAYNVVWPNPPFICNTKHHRIQQN